MFFQKSCVVALATALFVSSGASLSLEEEAKLDDTCALYSDSPITDIPPKCYSLRFCAQDIKPTECIYDETKDYDDVESLKDLDPYCIRQLICYNQHSKRSRDSVVSIKYPRKKASPLVDHLYFNGQVCAEMHDDMDKIPHQCLYRKVCHGSVPPIKNAKQAPSGFYDKMTYERKDLDSQSYCAYEMLCKGKQPIRQSAKDERTEKNKVATEIRCKPLYYKLDSVPKECIMQGSFKRGKEFNYYNKALHVARGQSCDKFEKILDSVPKQCVVRSAEKLEILYPPPIIKT